MSPLVSVLIPSYNHQQYLAETLRSVLGQSCTDLEVLVLDDGSQDESFQLAQSFADQDNRLRVWRQENHGTVGTLNNLYKASSSPVICQLGSDDVWEPDFVENSLRDLENHPDTPATFCRFHAIDQNGDITFTAPFPFCDELSGNALLEYLVPHNCLGALTACIRRSAIERTLPFARQLRGVEDWDLWLRLSKLGPLRVRNFIGAKYRVHGGNQSLSISQDVAFNHLKVLHDHSADLFAKYRLTSQCFSKMLSNKISLLNRVGKIDRCVFWLEKKKEKVGLDLGESLFLAENYIRLGQANQAADFLRSLRTA